MLVNNKKSGHLYFRVAVKTEHILHMFCLSPQTMKTSISQQHNHTKILVGEMLRNHLVLVQQYISPEASCKGTTIQGEKIREPATSICVAYLRPKSQSTTVHLTETKPRPCHLGSRPGPAHYYRVFCRQLESDESGHC